MVERLFCIQEVEGSIPSKSKEKNSMGILVRDRQEVWGPNPHRSKNKIRDLTSNFLNLVFTDH